jgi:hypothetical protein
MVDMHQSASVTILYIHDGPKTTGRVAINYNEVISVIDIINMLNTVIIVDTLISWMLVMIWLK